ncbi:MAG: hypothetical protein GF364_05865 [Candidatus Lokiarchaeota archaeon]|nr:hypothetical protein [Candidatus Lokiarchaeota archaeon]
MKMKKLKLVPKIFIITTTILFASIYIASSIINRKRILWPDILLTILMWSAISALFFYSCINSDLGCLIIRLIGNASWVGLIYYLALYDQFNFLNIFPVAYILLLILLLGNILSFILTISVLIIPFVQNERNLDGKRAHRRELININARKSKIALIIVFVLLIPFTILLIPNLWSIPITIIPKDYKADLAFWSGFDKFQPNETIGNNLNEHSVTIVMCNFPDCYNITELAEFVSVMTKWNTTYNNISFYLSIPGLPGGYVWDGVAENVVDYSKHIISKIQHYNLTNIKGLAFDLELPFPDFLPENYDLTPNRTRHDEAIKIFEDFLNWKEINAPDINISAINYIDSAVDVFDNDLDLHYIRKYHFFDVAGWDEYAPMVYRCACWGTRPYGDSPKQGIIAKYIDGGHYWVYSQLKLFTDAHDLKFGTREKMDIYLGITNCTCYGADVRQYESGEFTGYGYDNLVRDTLIAKHFRIPKITIFLLNTSLERGYSMGGVFESYGNSFLDDFNESINGKDSTNPFTIWYKPRLNLLFSVGAVEYFFYDLFADIDSLFGVLYVAILIIGSYAVIKIISSPADK